MTQQERFYQKDHLPPVDFSVARKRWCTRSALNTRRNAQRGINSEMLLPNVPIQAFNQQDNFPVWALAKTLPRQL